MCRKTAMQTERDKQGLIDGVPVGKSPLVVPHPPDGVWTQENFYKKLADEPPERRLRPRLAAPEEFIGGQMPA